MVTRMVLTHVAVVASLLLGSAGLSTAGTYTFAATADASALSDFPTLTSGTNTRLTVDGSPQQLTAMRFAVSGITGSVSSAKLRLYVNNPSTEGPSVFVTASPWSESTLSWNVRPVPTGAALAKLGSFVTATWVEVPVTAAIAADGTYNFMLVSTVADGATFHSRETAERPQLVIVTEATTPPPPPPGPTPTTGSTVDVTLQPRAGVADIQVVNFAVPLAPGQLVDATRVRVLKGGSEISAARRALARHPDGSVRSVQLQVQTAVATGTMLQVRINEAATTPALALVAVSTTLEPADGTLGPRVWARLPASWLSASGVTGPQVPESVVDGTALDAFDNVCDYANHATSQFLSLQTSKDVWLYDRGTTMYRGYARRGDQVTLESGYRETSIYRNGMTGTGTATRIAVPGASEDTKYHYAQNLAIHYLLTGDDRFRESAENLADRMAALWSSPDYAGGSDFWTERHAGFALLAYVWAGIVSDDQATKNTQRATDAVDAYLSIMTRYAPGWTDQAARCFSHQASAHGESYGTWGCSPWMSAILADGLDAYATEIGGADAAAARAAIVKLGTVIARDGRDSSGKPYYWMGMGTASDEVDPYHEHWGEPAYVVAMAWHHGGRSDATLKTAAMAMLAGEKTHASSPHMRSFNWQCRSAVAAPYYLR